MKSWYLLFTIKRYLEQLIMFPFVLLGKIIALLNPLEKDYDIFCFFPCYSVGGGEYVNANIIKALDDQQIIIFFSKNSYNDGMRHFFDRPNVTIKEINKWTDNKYIYWASFILRGVCSQYINTQKKKCVVFIGNANFGYKLTPHIKRSIKIVELIHMHEVKFTWVWAPFIQFIDTRILLANSIKETFKKVYANIGIPEKYIDNVRIIPNCLETIPTELIKKEFTLPLKIYYAGRGGAQKRVWIIFKIIEKCRSLKLPVEFKLAGSFNNEVPKHLIDDGTFIGELKGGEAMHQFHQQNDVLLMTSAWEGFPIVIMEAMVYGAIPLVSGVDAILDHVHENKNGFLLNASLSEEEIVQEAVEKINYLINHLDELPAIAKNGFEYVNNHFSKEKFVANYRDALLN